MWYSEMSDTCEVIMSIREFGVCEGGKIELFIFPAVGLLFNMAGVTLYYVPLN
jgi:hypothetical protein